MYCSPSSSGATRDALSNALAALSKADALLITSGAGMGVDSGLATYHGRNAGVWPPMGALGMDMSDLSTPRWFEVDPRLAWNFWRYRADLYMNKSAPHKGYNILSELGESMAHGFFSVTSNVDGHWGRVISHDLIWEVHGAVTHSQLVEDDGRFWETDMEEILRLQAPEWDVDPGDHVNVRPANRRLSSASKRLLVEGTVCDDGSSLRDKRGRTLIASEVYKNNDGPDLLRILPSCELPVCPVSGKPIRPNVLMFGDYGINMARNNQQAEAYSRFLESLPRDCRLLIIEIGAGHAVPTIRMVSEEAAEDFPNAVLLRINIDDSETPVHLEDRGISLPMGALETLESLRNAMPIADRREQNDETPSTK